MVPPWEAARICTFLCFNVVYVVSAVWFGLHAFMVYLIRRESTLLMESSTFISVISVNSLLTMLVLIVAIFGFVAFCMDKPKLFRVYAILLSIGLFLQITNEFLIDKANDELITSNLKQKLAIFESVFSELQDTIQETQQEFDCCGHKLERGYQDYYRPSDLYPGSKIPNSCCGKFVKGSGRAIGACSFEEYSQRPGCGDKLVKAFRDYLRETDPFIVFQKVRLVIVIIYEIVQAIAIGLSFYVYMARKDRYHGTGSQVFYKANG